MVEPYILKFLVQERSLGIRILSMGKTKFSGLMKFDGVWRHLDVFISTFEEYPYALLSHTGPRDSNVDMRRLAKSKGWKLNEKGLYGSDGERIKIKGGREEDIYQTLGLKYIAPKDRV